jgi:glycosyltransferase involved in cell wall biosynthesis
MRIAIATNVLLPADREGGTAHSNFYLAKALRAAGAEVRVVTTDRNGPGRLDVTRDAWTETEGISIFYASTAAGAWIRSASYEDAIRQAVAESDVCILSGVFWNFTGLAAVRACRRYGVPYVTMPRGLLGKRALAHKGLKKKLYWWCLARWLVQGSKGVIALARQELEDIRAAGVGVPGFIVPNGAFVEVEAGIQAEMTGPGTLKGVPDDSRYILFLGRLHPIKGLNILIPAFDKVAKIDPEVLLVIAGSAEPTYSSEVASLLSRAAARDRIRLVGNVSGAQKSRLIARARAFALTSRGEGLPIAVLEALSAGVPVVITPNCNLPEVAAAGAGIEVQPTVESASAGLALILQDEAVREEMAANARRLAIESFSWQGVGERVLQICRSVAGKEAAAGVAAA